MEVLRGRAIHVAADGPAPPGGEEDGMEGASPTHSVAVSKVLFF